MSRRVSVLLGVVGASLFAASGAFAQAAGGSVSVGGSATTAPPPAPGAPGAPPPPAAGVSASGTATAGATAAPAPAGGAAAAGIGLDGQPLRPGQTKPDGAPRFLFDVHVGGLIELDPDEETESPGGALIGGNVFYGPIKWLDIGLGYERSFLGTDDVAAPVGAEQTATSRTTRGAHALWLTPRFYPYENEDFAFFVEMAAGPVWQTMSASNTLTGVPGEGAEATVQAGACDAYDSARFGIRGGAGFLFPLTSAVIMHAQLGVDHYAFDNDLVDNCAVAGNSTTFFAGRVGFALATGRKRIKDTDGDNIYDDVDKCVDKPGLPNDNPELHGCPPADRDGDTILDVNDACPDVPGAPNADPTKNGCPLPGDIDGDGIPDPVDACPTVPGAANPDPAKNGCPLVVVTAGEIKINEQVQFDTDKATIKPVSNALLDTVAKVIKEHPEIKKIEVQGHTDSQGPKAHNQQLSTQRSESVRKALESRGVEKTRLVSKGYGQDKPIGDNSTDAGRTQNRRVQFVILEKTDAPPKVIGTEVAPGATQVTPPAAPPAAPAPAPKP